MKTIVALEDHPLIFSVLKEILSSLNEDYEMTEYSSLQGLSAHSGKVPDIVVFDLGVADATKQEVLACVTSQFSESKLVCFTSENSSEWLELLENAGVIYIGKEFPYKQIIAGLQQAMGSQSVNLELDTNRNSYQSLIVAPNMNKPLTLKQVEVMEATCDGLSAKEIAKKLTMSPETVRAHLRAAFDRLGASNKASAIQIFMQAKTISERLYGNKT